MEKSGMGKGGEKASPKIDVPKAKSAIERAISLHMKHMDGRAPTTGKEGEKSQQAMMDMMVEAWKALGGGS